MGERGSTELLMIYTIYWGCTCHSHPPLTESDTRQSRQALSSLEGGRQIPCSVINPVTKRAGVTSKP